MVTLFEEIWITPNFKPTISGKFDHVPGGNGSYTLGKAYKVLGLVVPSNEGHPKFFFEDNYGNFVWAEAFQFSRATPEAVLAARTLEGKKNGAVVMETTTPSFEITDEGTRTVTAVKNKKTANADSE